MKDAVIETKPPETDDNGFERAGDWPLNHRLRAEALARAGEDKDPDGLIGDDLIADTAARLKSEDEAAAAEAAENPPLAKMTTAQLEKVAADESIDIAGARKNSDRVELIEAARAARQNTGA